MAADPFSPLSFGSRPGFACYWPDTRFVELYPNSDYFRKLVGRAPADTDLDLVAIAESVVHHEQVHWQVAHCLSWGMMRSALISMKTTLAGLFLRQQDPQALCTLVETRIGGLPPIQRSPEFDLLICPSWSGLLHSTAEHAWACAIFPFFMDRNNVSLASLRPPEFLLGIVSQYLANSFSARDVLETPDQVFQDRVKTFKRDRKFDDVLAPSLHDWPSPQSIEECLAVVSQLMHLNEAVTQGDDLDAIIRAFKTELLDSIFGGQNETYAHCFRCAADALSTRVEDLDFSLLGLVCELALDPPLPFERDGTATDWEWDSFHPTLRFKRLIQKVAEVRKGNWDEIRVLHVDDMCDVASTLLRLARLERASSRDLIQWLQTFDEDTTEWASEELAYDHAQFSIVGRKALDQSPGILHDPARYQPSVPSEELFYTLPYVLIDGHSEVVEETEGPDTMRLSRHALNAYISRATDHLVFGSGSLPLVGLPRSDEDGLSRYAHEVHEVFCSSLHADVPKFAL